MQCHRGAPEAIGTTFFRYVTLPRPEDFKHIPNTPWDVCFNIGLICMVQDFTSKVLQGTVYFIM
jgi:hypothetical protein